MKILLIILLLIPFAINAQMKEEVFHYGNDGLYLKYTPTTLPIRGVVVYFAGIGEEGNTMEDLLGPNGPKHNPIPLLFTKGIEKPYIFIVPMLKTGSSSWPTSVLINMLDILDVYKNQGMDIHATGLSLGGIAVHGLAHEAYIRHGKGYFKTIGAVCGRINFPNAAWYDSTFVKLWHGTADPTLKFNPDLALWKLLSTTYNKDSISNNLRQIQHKWYINAGHNIWNWAYDESVDGYWAWSDSIAPAKQENEKVTSMEISPDRFLILKTDLGNVFKTAVTK